MSTNNQSIESGMPSPVFAVNDKCHRCLGISVDCSFVTAGSPIAI